MLEKLFEPKSIAVIGASNERGSVGYTIFNNLLKEYKGKLFAVNPFHERIQGKKSYKSIKEIGERIDLAVIAVPAKIVPKVMKECIEARVINAIIISAGFSEIGNFALENKLRETIANSKIRVLGPNCFGVFNAANKLNATFIDSNRTKIPKKGKISLISQSGALGISLLDLIANNYGGIAKFVSYGNAIDINEVELINYLKEDKETEIIAIYIEGTRNGKGFLNALKEASRKKKIIVLKGGKFEETSRAAASHTGSLAGSAEIYSAAFKQAKAIEVENIMELVNFSRIIEKQPIPKGKKTLIITNGGGCGVIASDLVIKHGLELAELSKEAKEKLSKGLASIATISNPLDLTGGATAEDYKIALEEALKDKGIDSIVIIALFALPALTKKLIDIFPQKKEKPIIFIALDTASLNLRKDLEKRGISCFDSVEDAIKSLSILTNCKKTNH